MRPLKTLLFVFVFVLSSFAFTSSQAKKDLPLKEILIKLKFSPNKAALLQLAHLGLKIDERFKLSFGEFIKVKVPGHQLLERILEKINHLSWVSYAEENVQYHIINTLPADPKFDLLWGLFNEGHNEPERSGDRSDEEGVVGADANALPAWALINGSRKIKIAIIDTGIDWNHEDLAGNVWVNEAELNGIEGVDDDQNGYIDDVRGYDFANKKPDGLDDHGHGTHCAGTIGALHSNDIGVAGVMGEVTLVPIKFLSKAGGGSLDAAVKAVDYAISLNVDVMSNSWGGGSKAQALQDAIEAAAEKGIVFVAAAGNNSRDIDNEPFYPASYPVKNIIVVGAHTAQDSVSVFSNTGRKTVHLLAPGTNILSTFLDNKYKVYSGTSMATPHVSGAIGLLFAHLGERMDLELLAQRLVDTSTPVPAYRRAAKKGGRLNVYNLLTNTIPERIEPVEGAWKKYTLPEVFATDHPYTNSLVLEKEFKIEGAKFIRVVIKEYDIEKKWDWLYVMNSVGPSLIEKVSGKGENYTTDYIFGDTITIKFSSDAVVAKWGFEIAELEYQ